MRGQIHAYWPKRHLFPLTPVIIAEDPLTCVARGGGRALEMMDEKGVDVFASE